MDKDKLTLQDDFHFLNLIRFITNNTPFLVFNEQYFEVFIHKFKTSESKDIRKDFLWNLYFDIDLTNLPEPFKGVIDTIIAATYDSPVYIYQIHYTMKKGFTYLLDLNDKDFKIENIPTWLKLKQHPRNIEIELRWPFFDQSQKEFLREELLTNEYNRLLTKGILLGSAFDNFRTNTNDSILSLVKVFEEQTT